MLGSLIKSKKFKWLVVFFILLDVLTVAAIAAGAYVRLASSDPAEWHVPVEAAADEDLEGGVIRILPGTPERFSQLDEIIRATPRTQVLAGAVEDGRITYVTRSFLWGFPDYATVEFDGAVQISIYSRLRFGRSDLGVNGERVDNWIATLEAGS